MRLRYAAVQARRRGHEDFSDLHPAADRVGALVTFVDAAKANLSGPLPGPSRIAKLSPPRSSAILRRNRVLAAIEGAVASGVCWIAAPGGYGKTTAVLDYLAKLGVPHVWFRTDEGDQDIARFFQYLARTLTSATAHEMPVFGVEYVEQPEEFARRFFRAYFARLKPGTILVLDDLHDADTSEFRAMLSTMFRELPQGIFSICISRALPQEELADLVLKRQLIVLDRSALEFSATEARELVEMRSTGAKGMVDVETAQGWAVGLVLLTDNASASAGGERAVGGQVSLSDVLGRHFFRSLPAADQDMLLKLNLLPEISAKLADAMIGSSDAGKLLDRLYRRQLLVTRADNGRDVFFLHDLLRDFLDRRFAEQVPRADQVALRRKAAMLLVEAGRIDEAIPLALQAEDWALASSLILGRAETILAQGGRATLIDWLRRMPEEEMNGWHFYWLGVAHMPDDATSEHWLSKAWLAFGASSDGQGACLTVARAVLVKTDSWRTHEGLSTWLTHAFSIIERGIPDLPGEDALLARIGLMRALSFADDYDTQSPAVVALHMELMERLIRNPGGDPSGLRLQVSETLIEHAVSVVRADLFEQAIDSVADDLLSKDVLPWILGAWLVSFGSKSGRYFPYQRRGFPYPSAEAALRAAIEIGEREALRAIEFGGLYHLQMQMKFRNDFGELRQIVARLAEIADSRFTTQVAVVADCNAALHARQGDFTSAYRDCDRFMAAIEAANEPMVERLPHYFTKAQVLLADRKPHDAVTLLKSILPRLEGGSRKRTQILILAAEAADGLWNGYPHYADRLAAFLSQLRETNWPMVLLNLPELLAELLGDAVEHGIEPDLCRSLILERRLAPPVRRPASWPWSLKIHVMAGLLLELDGKPLDLGAKPPTKALDILRALAISKDNVCSLETLQDWLWPDLDGDQAKAACEQALHRLRKLLGRTDLLVQREGKLRLASDKVWVDLAAWNSGLRAFLAGNRPAAERPHGEALFDSFRGPLLLHERTTSWSVAVAEKLRNDLMGLALQLGGQFEAVGKPDAARSIYLKAFDFYPDAAPICKALVKQRLSMNDVDGAVAEYRRYEQAVIAAGESVFALDLRALVEPYLVR